MASDQAAGLCPRASGWPHHTVIEHHTRPYTFPSSLPPGVGVSVGLIRWHLPDETKMLLLQNGTGRVSVWYIYVKRVRPQKREQSTHLLTHVVLQGLCQTYNIVNASFFFFSVFKEKLEYESHAGAHLLNVCMLTLKKLLEIDKPGNLFSTADLKATCLRISGTQRVC